MENEYSLNNSSDPYETPQKFGKQIRQRTYECNKNFPKSKDMQCAIINRQICQRLNSPTTQTTMSRIIDRYSSRTLTTHECNDSQKNTTPYENKVSKLVKSVIKIQKYKWSKNMPKFHEYVKELKEKYSVRDAARTLKMHYSQLYSLLTSKKKPHGRAMSHGLKKNVVNCYLSNKISQQLPYKRFEKVHFLRTSLAVAYEMYAKEQMKLGFRVLSQSSVYRCLKGRFRIRKKIPFKDTQCADCVNSSLLVDALIVAKVKGIRRRNTENVLNSFCPLSDKDSAHRDNTTSRKLEWHDNSEVITDHKRDCIFRNCKKCGAISTLQESIIKQNPNIDWAKQVTWHQWQYILVDNGENNTKKKRVIDKIRYRGPLARLLTKFIGSVSAMSTHLFHFRWQAMQFDECKKQLRVGDVMLIMDFSTNYSHHRQGEVHGGFWCRKQTTMHPIITYYPCPRKCDQLVCDEIMLVSSDVKHDSFAVDTYVDKALSHLKENGIPIKRIIMWSDNCGTQYKSCKVFDSLSKFKDIPVMRNYFCAKHGKAEADGAIGRLSMHIDAVVRSGSQEFSDAGEVVRYCNIKLRVHNNNDAMCCHWQRHYFEESDINRDINTKSETVKGTLSFHSVRNVGIPGIIEVRESSCFCEVCFANESGECKNAHLVEDFAWASLYKDQQIEDKFENKIWECYSVPYRYAKKNILKSRAKRQISNVKTRKKKSKVGTLQKSSATGDVNSRNQPVSDYTSSDDSDFEDNIPLQIVQDGLNAMSGESPICGRTRIRKRLHKEGVIKCETQRELWDLDDYEASTPKTEHKPVAMLESRGLGVQPFSPIDNKKKFCEPRVTSLFNKDSRTTTVNEGQKMTEVTRTSTPRNNKVSAECRIELSPIQNAIPFTKALPSFSEQKCNDSKIHGQSENSDYEDNIPLKVLREQKIAATSQVCSINHSHDSTSDNSDYEDDIPLTIVQAGLKTMSDKSPISGRTRIKKGHDFTSRYDWVKLNKRFIQCTTWDELQAIVQKEMDKLPSLPDCLIGDIAVDGDEVDTAAKKDIPSDICQRFKVHYPICIEPDGNCFFRSISRLLYGSEDHHIEMRCRIIIDSVGNLKNYTDHDYLMRCASHVHKNCSNIASYYCSYSGVSNVGIRDQSSKGIQSVFRDDVMRICKLKQHCGPWQFHSAANVLNSKLIMVFPSTNICSDVRVDYNRVFCPSKIDSNKTKEFGLLWTGVCIDNTKIYNHIVPLITR